MKKVGGYCHRCARPRISCVCRQSRTQKEYHRSLDELEKVAEAVNRAIPPYLDPSVSPGVGGEVRQRRTPKPGIPHFSIEHDYRGIKLRYLNFEALVAAMRYAQTHEFCFISNGYIILERRP